jgi:hypothetical protein
VSESIEVQGIIGGGVDEEPKPIIQVRFVRDGETVAMGQWDPDDAYEWGKLLQGAIANAVYETALFRWFTEEMEIEPEKVAGAIEGVRLYRADLWGQPTIPEDWRMGDVAE